MSLLPIFFLPGPSALCCSFIQMGERGREGHSPSLSFPPAKMHAPHSAFSSPDDHSGGGGEEEGPRMEEKGGFPVPFRYNVGGGVICIPGRLGHSLPLSSPFPAAPLPCSRNSAAEGERERERVEKGSFPPTGGHTTSPLSFLPPFSLLEFFPVRTNLRGRRGGGGKLRGLHLSQAILGVPQLCSRKGKYRT